MSISKNSILPIITSCLLLTGCINNELERKPNIIYILADDLGYGELGAYGQQLIETPNIDALATNGMKFTQHYSGSPVCAPSRNVLLTGMHTGHAHVRGNDEWAARGDVRNYEKVEEDPNLEGQKPIPADIPTIGNVLQNAGYKTALVGKWGLGAPMTDGVPNNRGFDFFYGYNCQRQAHMLYPKHLWRNKEKVELNNELVPAHEQLSTEQDPLDSKSYERFIQQDYAPKMMLDEALAFLDRSENEPFFLYFASPLTHVPLQVPQDYVDKYVKKFGDEEPYVGNRGYYPHRYPKAAYAAMVTYLDDQVGALVQKLKEMGEYDNTLIIFSSDNGPTYTGGANSDFFNSAGPFNNGYGWTKGFTHEGGIRVPMIAQWPDKINPNTTTDLISAFWDVLPTLAEVAGVDPPKKSDGISFLSELLGENDQEVHDYLYWEFPAYQGQQAVRMGDWKGIRKNILKGNMKIELYNLKNDPKELEDQSQGNPDIIKKINDIMKESHVPSNLDGFKMEALGDVMTD